MPLDLNDPRIQLATQLGLALATVYVKPEDMAKFQQADVALGALLKGAALLKESQGRPDGWEPSAELWGAFRAEQQADIDAERAKLAQLPPVEPNDSGPRPDTP